MFPTPFYIYLIFTSSNSLNPHFGSTYYVPDPGTQREFLLRVHSILKKMHTKQVLWNYSHMKRKMVFYPQVFGKGSLKKVKPAAITSSLLIYSNYMCQVKGGKKEMAKEAILASALNSTMQLSWVLNQLASNRIPSSIPGKMNINV